LNNITGTWSPAFNNNVSQSYTFTPTAGQCASTAATFVQIIDNSTIPQFAAQGPYCINAPMSPLPTTSINGIAGTWSPALNNAQTTTYTFTPLATSCGSSTSMTIQIDTMVLPVFIPITPICAGQALSLPLISNNGISGTWSPAVNNTQTTTYTF